MSTKKRKPRWMRRFLRIVVATAWLLRRQLLKIASLFFIDVHHTLGNDQNTIKTGLTYEAIEEGDGYTRRHTIEDGIERIVYTPAERRYDQPIVMLHGMWHGAWCWERWQRLFAAWGWETHAFSLPGHGQSPEQRPIRDCTLDYYLWFLRAEMERFESPPILMGHSMGGALAQWYLKYVRDDMPAVVLVAAWVAKSALQDGLPRFLRLDPLGVLMTVVDMTATPYIRNPEVAASKLISPRADITPQELHAKLGPESTLVMLQHNPPLWSPKDKVRAPMLYVAGVEDAVLGLEAARETANHYGADFIAIPEAGHNLMMDVDFDGTARQIHAWLEGHIPTA